MKLDDLKTLWDSATAPDPNFDRDQLRRLLQNKSSSTIGKIRRNIILEIIFLAVAALAVLAWFAFRSLPVHWGEWVLFTMLFPLSGVLYWYKFRAFVKHDSVSQDLFHSLDTYIQSFDRYLNLYKATMVFLIPVLSIVGIMYGFTLARVEDGKDLTGVPTGVWALLGGVTIVYIFLAMWFSKWYVNKLYGRHLRELKSIRAELEEGQ
ncbi:MAG: hypothetical protein NWR72_00430 [Bacteroidia bacterium]|nr:hypothetical protein [Bacteroidia bacterium]